LFLLKKYDIIFIEIEGRGLKMIKLWIDDVRVAPNGYYGVRSVQEAKSFFLKNKDNIELIDTDHDAGRYASEGGDYVKFFDWLESNYHLNNWSIPPIKIHSMNPTGVANIRAIIEHNNWTEIY
jgi:hypothetical protein